MALRSAGRRRAVMATGSVSSPLAPGAGAGAAGSPPMRQESGHVIPSACPTPRAAHCRPTPRSITEAIVPRTPRRPRARPGPPQAEPSGDVLQIELGSMEAFPVVAVDGEAVPDPDFVADGADVGGARRHESLYPNE